MAYPFAGFGAFLFKREEMALADTHWITSPTYARSRPLGSARDSVVTLAIGSDRRETEHNFEPDRYAAIHALINTEAVLTDWERPRPDSRQAILLNCVEQDRLAVLCTDGATRLKVRARLEWLSQ